jgi:hypothetical protein
MSDIDRLLQDLHDSEINAEIGWFYDGVWWAKIGDAFNGFDAEGRCRSLSEAAEWLRAAAIRLYPDSVFAQRYRRGFE